MQGSVLGTVLLSIFSSGGGDGAWSVDDMKFEEASGMWGSSDARQRGLDSLEEKTNRKLIKFQKVRCKSLDQGTRSPWQYVQAVSWLTGKHLCKKSLGLWQTISWMNDYIVLLHLAHFGQCLKYCIQIWAPSIRQKVNWTEFRVGAP